jgi:hypothetical protein
MNLLDDAVVKDIYSEVLADERVAKWETQLLAQMSLPVNHYDNHGVHQQLHSLELKKLDNQKLRINDPRQYTKVLTQFMEHMQMHGAFIEEARRQMLEEQIALKGGGNDGGGQKASGSGGRSRLAVVGQRA